MVPNDSLGVLCYLHSVVSMALSCIISELKRDISQKSRFFHTPAFATPVRVIPVRVLMCRLVWNKKLSCRREIARCFMSLKIWLSHSRSLKVIRN